MPISRSNVPIDLDAYFSRPDTPAPHSPVATLMRWAVKSGVPGTLDEIRETCREALEGKGGSGRLRAARMALLIRFPEVLKGVGAAQWRKVALLAMKGRKRASNDG
ncbi:MAG TPA: hypothetical protein VJQ59_02050 [Candidatus Sulfotelmatobacter sp.]|nr:hypothetical protein [Candidatus Sulfotelmatobacter sp.]